MLQISMQKRAEVPTLQQQLDIVKYSSGNLQLSQSLESPKKAQEDHKVPWLPGYKAGKGPKPADPGQDDKQDQ